MTQSELLRIGGVCGLNTLDEVIDAARVLHEAGSIVYFDKVSALKDLGTLTFLFFFPPLFPPPSFIYLLLILFLPFRRLLSPLLFFEFEVFSFWTIPQ